MDENLTMDTTLLAYNGMKDLKDTFPLKNVRILHLDGKSCLKLLQNIT